MIKKLWIILLAFISIFIISCSAAPSCSDADAKSQIFESARELSYMDRLANEYYPDIYNGDTSEIELKLENVVDEDDSDTKARECFAQLHVNHPEDGWFYNWDVYYTVAESEDGKVVVDAEITQ